MSGIRMLGLYLMPLFLFLLPSMLMAEENVTQTDEPATNETATVETVTAEAEATEVEAVEPVTDESVTDESVTDEKVPPEQAVIQAVPVQEETPTAVDTPTGDTPTGDTPAGDTPVDESDVEGVSTVEDVSAIEETNEDGGMPKSWSMVVLSNRTTFGMLGSDMVAEYGVQIEMTSKKFGIRAHWANFQPYPDNVGFCWDLGFAFHYYPFGNGPSGLYAGPGFMFVQMFQNPDPMRMIQTELRKRLARENLANTTATGDYRQPPMDIVDMGLIVNHRTGYGHQFNLLVPQLEVGYRHRWPQGDASVYFIVGIEATLGYAVSDIVNYWGHDFMWTLNPQLGLGF